MRAGARARLILALGSALAVALSVSSSPAFATTSDTAAGPSGSDAEKAPKHHVHAVSHAAVHVAQRDRKRTHIHTASALQCVPFARAESGIVIKGNAANWWDAAAGVYARGSQPEAGAVLNFRATGHMRLGHVAVVTNVLSTREIEIDHANWAWTGATHGNITLATRVVDVSPNNDWTAVRVELGHSGGFGSVYPTYGFIYDRPDNGTMIANTLATLHPTAERPALDADEVAEAPAPHGGTGITLPVDAPDHSLR